MWDCRASTSKFETNKIEKRYRIEVMKVATPFAVKEFPFFQRLRQLFAPVQLAVKSAYDAQRKIVCADN